jgi:hypothetical protein
MTAELDEHPAQGRFAVWRRRRECTAGKSRGPHKAIFFFGTDAKGREYVGTNDVMSGPSPLDTYANNPSQVEPSGLLSGKFREAPALPAGSKRISSPIPGARSQATPCAASTDNVVSPRVLLIEICPRHTRHLGAERAINGKSLIAGIPL